MSKLETLKKNYEFKSILSKGTFYYGRQVEVFLKKNTKKKNIIGIAISTKAGKAVQRNHVKRLIRETYRKREDKLQKGYSIVFLWNKKEDIKKANYHCIGEDLDHIFEKAEMIKKGEK